MRLPGSTYGRWRSRFRAQPCDGLCYASLQGDRIPGLPVVHELPDGVERHLNRVEQGRVGWEVSEVDAPPLGRLGDGRDALIPQNTSSAMDGCVVEDEIAPGGHTRQELLKALSGDSSLEKAPGHVPAVPDAQQERVGPDTIARSPDHSSGTSRAPGVVLVVVEEEGTLARASVSELSTVAMDLENSAHLEASASVYAFAPLFLVHLRSLSNREMDCLETITEWCRLRLSRMSPSVATLCRVTQEMTASPISLEVFRRRWRLFRGRVMSRGVRCHR